MICSASPSCARMTGAVGEIVEVPVPQGTDANPALRLVLLVGVGRARPIDVRRAGAALARATRDRDAVATSIPAVAPDGDPVPDATALEAFVAGTMLGAFEFHWRSTGPKRQPVRQVVIATPPGTLAGADQAALARAVAIGGAGWRSRMLATVPSNLKNPAWLADQAEQVAAAAGLDGPHLGRGRSRARRLRRHPGRRPGLGDPAPADPARLHARGRRRSNGEEASARRARGQGHHVRHRRPLDQARSEHGRDEARHDRRCGGAGDDGRARRRGLPGAGDRSRACSRERDLRICDPPGRRDPALGWPHLRGHQHRRRGPAGPRRRPRLRRGASSTRPCSSTSPHSPAG